MMGFHLHDRAANHEAGDPGGETVSKNAKLPEGDFGITEFIWPDMNLWFVDEDEFTEDEREEVHDMLLECEPGGKFWEIDA